ncbi:MAG: response regulator [Campylobacterales bacterium]|nr:response regulator [Campylobacterales bacterium]
MDYKVALRTMSVLYCEDEVLAREQMVRILSPKVGELHVAEDGKEGLLTYQNRKIDLVISDIKMPRINGLDMAREIKTINPKAGIVLLTAFDQTKLLQEAIDIGISQYVVKPVAEDKLFNGINRTLDYIIAEKKIAFQNNYIRNILDLQSNMIIVGDECAIHAANQPFLEFFGYEDLSDMIKSQNEKLNNKFQFIEYQYIDFMDWFLEMISSRERKREVFVLEGDVNKKFTCQVSSFENISGRFLVSLTDITHMNTVKGQLNDGDAPEVMELENFYQNSDLFFHKGVTEDFLLVIFTLYNSDLIVIDGGFDKRESMRREIERFVLTNITDKKMLTKTESDEYLMIVNVVDLDMATHNFSVMKKKIQERVKRYHKKTTANLHYIRVSPEEDFRKAVTLARQKHIKANQSLYK